MAVEYAMAGAIVNVEIALRAKCCRDTQPDQVDADREPCEPAGARRVDRFHFSMRKARWPRAAARSRDWFGFLDQHDWNVIAHRILEFARAADQTVLLVIEMQVALAFRARQDVEQFLTQRHRRNPPRTLFLLLRISHRCRRHLPKYQLVERARIGRVHRHFEPESV